LQAGPKTRSVFAYLPAAVSRAPRGELGGQTRETRERFAVPACRSCAAIEGVALVMFAFSIVSILYA
jgi:hypothetical protein